MLYQRGKTHKHDYLTTPRIIQHFCPLIILVANSASSQRNPLSLASSTYPLPPSNKCPHAYWDEPSNKCSENLLRLLEEIRLSSNPVSMDLRFNKTCREWDRANECYQRLLHQCRNDPSALHELKLHMNRYTIYSRPCKDPSLRYRQTMADCFLPEVKSTKSCTETIDKFLRRFLVTHDYRSACRVISASMKCFHEVKDNILQRCRQDGAIEYQRSYIMPLVEQTRDLVLKQCNLTPPYDEYYLLYSSASLHTMTILTALTACLAAYEIFNSFIVLLIIKHVCFQILSSGSSVLFSHRKSYNSLFITIKFAFKSTAHFFKCFIPLMLLLRSMCFFFFFFVFSFFRAFLDVAKSKFLRLDEVPAWRPRSLTPIVLCLFCILLRNGGLLGWTFLRL